MTPEKHRPVIGITMGDPVGIGPEICLLALRDPSIHAICKPLIIGDARILSSAKRALGSDLYINPIQNPVTGIYKKGSMDIVGLSDLDPKTSLAGRPTRQTGQAMVAYVKAAIDMALDGRLAAIVTGPINKSAMKMAGFSFKGHTELLSQRTKTDQVVMMLAGETLRVALVTIHEPLRHVPDLLSIDRIYDTISITAQSLIRRFGIERPSLAVAGLNPHAGEEGILGKEERDIIAPAIDRSRKDGYHVEGPFPPDTIFPLAAKGRYDAVICMYHDQGLIPFKMIHFDNGVNTTLGLPIIRTSVDHGTAYDIAGTGTADPGSMVAAIRMAAIQSLSIQPGPGVTG